MSNPLKLHFMLYMFHAHQATVRTATAQNLFQNVQMTAIMLYMQCHL